MFDGTIKPSYDNSLDKLIDISLTSVLSIFAVVGVLHQQLFHR